MAEKKQATPAVASDEELALLDKIVGKVKEAQKVFATYTQEQVDKIFFWKKLMGPSTSKTHLRTPKGTICLTVHLKEMNIHNKLATIFL